MIKLKPGSPTYDVAIDSGLAWNYVSSWALTSWLGDIIAGVRPGPVHSLHKKGFLKNELIPDVIKLAIEKLGGTYAITYHNFYEEIGGYSAVYLFDTACMEIEYAPSDRALTVTGYFIDDALYNHLSAITEDWMSPKNCNYGTIQVLSEDPTCGLSTRIMGKAAEKLVAENYSPQVQQMIQDVTRNLSNPVPDGRLTILEGPPGTGKTYILRGIMEETPNVLFVFVPSTLVPSLGDPSLVPVLLDLRDKNNVPVVLVIEDADECLTTRQGDNMSSVSSLLNLTDGLMGSLLDLRVLATTNARKSDMDPAILRRGRLCRHIKVDALPPAQCNTIYERLTGTTTQAFVKNTVLADVYDEARGNTGSSNPKLPLGFKEGQ
jgi:hypothetical protein